MIENEQIKGRQKKIKQANKTTKQPQPNGTKTIEIQQTSNQ